MNFKDTLETELPEGQSLLAKLDHNGDSRVTWTRGDTVETNIAREAFNKARKEGFAAYRIKGDGMRGEVIAEFDPAAEKIILAPPLAGGI